MTSVQLKDLKGKAVGEVSFEDGIFGIEPNVHVMHAALHRQLANARSGSANTKTRAEVRGGGRKPWRQKGTGRARAGTIRSPLWNGGGVIFGPKPRDYSQSLPKKVRQLALRSALAARKDEFVVIQNFDGLFDKAPKSGEDHGKIEQPKTKKFVAALKDLGVHEKRVLVLLDNGIPGALHIERAARNICGVRVLNVINMNVKDLMEAEVVLTTERTIEVINQRFKPGAKTTSEQPQKAARGKKSGEGSEAKAEKKAAPKKAAKAAEPKAEKAKTTKTPAEGKAEKPAAKPKSKKSEE
jgi:large subunit ribosomal protein L4